MGRVEGRNRDRWNVEQGPRLRDATVEPINGASY